MKPTTLLIALLTSLGLTLTSCADDEGSPGDEARCAHVTYELTPSSALIAVGQTRRVTLEARSPDGELSVSDGATAALTGVANAGVVDVRQIDDGGRGAFEVEGLAPGISGFDVQIDGTTMTVPVEVVASPVVELGLTPETPMVNVDESVHITVTAFFADGTSRYVTPWVSWSIAPEGIIEVAESQITGPVTPIVGGRVTGLREGTAVVTARVGQVQAEIPVRVFSPQ